MDTSAGRLAWLGGFCPHWNRAADSRRWSSCRGPHWRRPSRSSRRFRRQVHRFASTVAVDERDGVTHPRHPNIALTARRRPANSLVSRPLSPCYFASRGPRVRVPSSPHNGERPGQRHLGDPAIATTEHSGPSQPLHDILNVKGPRRRPSRPSDPAVRTVQHAAISWLPSRVAQAGNSCVAQVLIVAKTMMLDR
jgi:hypothetical protein